VSGEEKKMGNNTTVYLDPHRMGRTLGIKPVARPFVQIQKNQGGIAKRNQNQSSTDKHWGRWKAKERKKATGVASGNGVTGKKKLTIALIS